MASCPNCGSSVGEDFGLVDCPQCGTPLYVEFDGQVRRRESLSPDAPTPQAEEAHLESQVESETVALPSESWLSSEDQQAIDQEHHQEHEEAFELSAIEEAPPLPEALPDEEVEMAELPDILLPEEPPARSSPDLSDLAQFASADALSQANSAYTYDLHFSGIDTKEVRDELREAMDDAKFLWDPDEILKSIKHGELKMKNITPVKASVLLNRIHHLPIQVKWVQHVAVQE